MGSSTDNPAAELRRRQLGDEDGRSSTPHAYAGNNELHVSNEERKKTDRKTYGRTHDGKGE
jgi:hypothetical protein